MRKEERTHVEQVSHYDGMYHHYGMLITLSTRKLHLPMELFCHCRRGYDHIFAAYFN